MNTGKRDTHEIAADILKVARDGAKKSHIVYKANLNFLVIKRYLGSLLISGLIEQVNRTYITTDKGVEFLSQFRELGRIWRP